MLSGPTDEVEALLDAFKSEKVKIRPAALQPGLPQRDGGTGPRRLGGRVLADIDVTLPEVAVVSSMLGRALAPQETFDGAVTGGARPGRR